MNAMLRRRMAPVRYDTTQLGARSRGGQTYPGGLDQVTPTLSLHPGALRDGLNFEVGINGGYGRIEGYERVDGRTAPSSASFVIVQVASFTNVPSVGDEISQATSGATGTVAAVDSIMLYMAVTEITGSFDDTNAITNTTTAQALGTATTTTVTLTAQQTAQHLAAAADIYRALIQAVPGSGDLLGVLAMAFAGVDELYAFRANVGGTAVNLYRRTASGWSQITFGEVVEFTAGGTAIPADGATLTQGGVTATVKRVMQRSGATGWTGDAAGGFVITGRAGGNFAAGAATLTGGATVTLSGAQTAITMLPGGHFEWAKANFGGQVSQRRAYGCDGVNKAFEFDGETVAPITTGLPIDAPSHIAAHKGFLFVSRDSSLIHSGPGTPFRYSAVDGGGEIAVGDTVTAMITLPGSEASPAMAVYQQANTAVLYGTDSSTWNLVAFNNGSGARPYSVQNLFDTFGFDNLGPVNLQTTLNFGNFLPTALCRNILPFILQNRAKVQASALNRLKGQYRVFFNDGNGLYLTLSGQTYLGAIPVLFPNPVYCCDTEITTNGEEVSYFGSSDGDGFVYQLDRGTSFDGEDVDSYITLAWDALRSPEVGKRFRAASIEIQSNAYAAVNFGYQLGYGSSAISQPTPLATESNFVAAPLWDEFTWDEFVWDGQTLAPTRVDMTGTAENVSVMISSSTNYIAAYQVNSITYHWSGRRGIRV